MHAAVCATAPELRSGLRGLSDGAAATLDSLLDLHDALLDRVPNRSDGALVQPSAAAAATNGAGKKRRRDAVAQDDSFDGAGCPAVSCLPCGEQNRSLDVRSCLSRSLDTHTDSKPM